jgi:hypothetical protein
MAGGSAQPLDHTHERAPARLTIFTSFASDDRGTAKKEAAARDFKVVLWVSAVERRPTWPAHHRGG